MYCVMIVCELSLMWHYYYLTGSYSLQISVLTMSHILSKLSKVMPSCTNATHGYCYLKGWRWVRDEVDWKWKDKILVRYQLREKDHWVERLSQMLVLRRVLVSSCARGNCLLTSGTQGDSLEAGDLYHGTPHMTVFSIALNSRDTSLFKETTGTWPEGHMSHKFLLTNLLAFYDFFCSLCWLLLPPISCFCLCCYFCLLANPHENMRQVESSIQRV